MEERTTREWGSLQYMGISLGIHLLVAVIAISIGLYLDTLKVKPTNVMEISLGEIVATSDDEKVVESGGGGSGGDPTAPRDIPPNPAPRLFNQTADPEKVDRAVGDSTEAPGSIRTDGDYVGNTPAGGGGGEDGGSQANYGDGIGSGSGGSGGGTGGGHGTGHGTGTGSGSGDVDWQGRFLARVDSRKVYPMSARRQNVTGLVRVHVSISGSGGLLSNSIVASSGDSRLDQAALDAVRASTPFPHQAGDTLTMTIPIRFRLD
jgi:TonB family C-terminal domain